MNIRFQRLFEPAGETPPAGGAPDPGAPPVETPPVETPPSEVPWSEFVAKHTDPTKLEPYKEAKTWAEVHELQTKRLADAQTALRTRQPGLPPHPGADAAPEVLSAWRKAHGLPETPEGYQLTKPETLPDELWDPNEAAEFAKFAHQQGLSPQVVKDLQAWYAGISQTKIGEMQQKQAAEIAAIRQSEATKLAELYGDRVDSTLGDLQAFAQAAGKDPAIFDPQSDKFWGVEAADLFAKLSARVPRGEGGMVRNIGAPSTTGAYDKAWAKAVLDPAHPDHKAFTDPKDPRHAEINRLRHEAYALG